MLADATLSAFFFRKVQVADFFADFFIKKFCAILLNHSNMTLPCR